jgi:hypothetical protein
VGMDRNPSLPFEPYSCCLQFCRVTLTGLGGNVIFQNAVYFAEVRREISGTPEMKRNQKRPPLFVGTAGF